MSYIDKKVFIATELINNCKLDRKKSQLNINKVGNFQDGRIDTFYVWLNVVVICVVTPNPCYCYLCHYYWCHYHSSFITDNIKKSLILLQFYKQCDMKRTLVLQDHSSSAKCEAKKRLWAFQLHWILDHGLDSMQLKWNTAKLYTVRYLYKQNYHYWVNYLMTR